MSSDLISIRCSSLPRLAQCPGSLRAAEGIVSEDSAQSLAGTAGHAALERYYNQFFAEENHNPIDAFTGSLDDITAGRARWYAKVMDGIIADHGGAQNIKTEVEMSVMLKNGFGVVKLTGHADLIVYCNDGVVLLSDWKFNFLSVPEAARNIQLMGYAYLLSKQQTAPTPFEEIHTVLIAGGNENPFTAAVYNPGTIERAEKHLFAIVRDAVAADARRIPSEDSCKYCPAKCTQRCPETLALIEEHGTELVGADENIQLPATKQDARDLYDKAKFLRSLCEKYEGMVKEAVQADPEGWADFFTLQSTGSTRTIKDAQAAYEVFVDTNSLLDAETFLSLVSLPIGKLEAACKDSLKERGVPVKDQKMMIAGLLGDNLELKEKAPSLKAVKND